MGLAITKFFNMFASNKETRLLMIGLDAAGKTSILYKLKLNEMVTTIPTVGFNVESVNYKNLNMNIWDVGGQDRIRVLWRHYFQNTDGVIFVVDSCDSERFEEAREELHKVMQDDFLPDAKCLVLANKQDLSHSESVSKIAESLGMNTLRQKWFIQATSALTGEGLYEGLDWMASAIKGRV